MRLLDRLDAANSGTECNTDAMTVFFGDLEAGIADCLGGGAYAVVDEWVVLALVFFWSKY